MLATKSNSYTFQKDGIWYFSRRVPADLRRHYRTGRIAYLLRTKSIKDARIRAMSDAAKLYQLLKKVTHFCGFAIFLILNQYGSEILRSASWVEQLRLRGRACP